MGIDQSYSYRQGAKYENFMCRAYQTTNNSKQGLDVSCMKNLIDAENGESFVAHLESFDKQLIKVKMYMHKAMDRYLQMKPLSGKMNILNNIKARIEPAKSTLELLQLIEQTLDETMAVTNYS